MSKVAGWRAHSQNTNSHIPRNTTGITLGCHKWKQAGFFFTSLPPFLPPCHPLLLPLLLDVGLRPPLIHHVSISTQTATQKGALMRNGEMEVCDGLGNGGVMGRSGGRRGWRVEGREKRGRGVEFQARTPVSSYMKYLRCQTD